MSLTNFEFLCAFALVLLIYYLVPKKAQWFVLLLSSIAYYLCAGYALLILYPVLSIGLCFAVSKGIVWAKDKPKLKSSFLAVGILTLLVVLLLLKYLKFSSALELLVPLGLSYYTFTLIGYLVDIYYGIAELQGNLLKLMAFGMYFPTLVSGPIMQYREVQESFFEIHRFDFDEFTRGLQRMLWGFFKKLVIAERLGVIVQTVYADPTGYRGGYIWFAILCFTFQLYTDFSGLMDIVLGISQCFGITLPENFQTPFFSKTISEYWRRWHMTLGVWFKEYVFYRILRLGIYGKLQKYFREKLGKKRGKQYATFVAMFVLWLTVGLWHGGNMTFVIGSGLLHWFYIVMEELLEKPMTKLLGRSHIDKDAGWLNKLRMLRTFVLVNIGNAFFRAPSVAAAITLLGAGFSRAVVREDLAGAGFLSRGVFALGLPWYDVIIAAFSLIILLIVSLLQYNKQASVREMIASKPIVLRFIIWFALLFYVILLGQYGPGYSAAEFIYQGF